MPAAFVDSAIHEGNTITVVYNGAGVADAFYQAIPFWASDDVNVLYPKFALTPEVALLTCTVIRKEKYRFSNGRKWHLERTERINIAFTDRLVRTPRLGLHESLYRSAALQ